MIYETPLAVSRDTIKKDVEQIFRHWTDGSKHLISHYLTPIEFREIASFTGSDSELVDWVKRFPYRVGTIYVVTDSDVVYDMDEHRPELCFYRILVRNDSINTEKQIVGGTR
jgi:quinolinate synthase